MNLPPRRPPDHSLPHITPEAVASALDQFVLPFQGGRDVNWLTEVVKREMEYSVLHPEYSPMRMSNSEVRQRIGRMADSVEATLDALRTFEREVRLHLAECASFTVPDSGPTSYGKMLQVIEELEPLAIFLREAEGDVEGQQGPWRQSEGKFWRIERARCLALIFEVAFGQPPTANNFPNDARHKAPTPFMDFYARMVTLAFGARETSNRAEVVKAACQLHREYPAQFAESMIPRL